MNDRLLGMLGLAVRAGKVTYGVFQTEKAINEGKMKLVVAATDMGESNKRRIESKCSANGVKLIFYSTKELLSRSAGKENMPVAGICDENLAAAVVKIYGGVTK